MSTALDLIQHDYRRRLKAQGIPRDPAKRSPEQEAVAAAEFWAAQTVVAMDAATLIQAAVED